MNTEQRLRRILADAKPVSQERVPHHEVVLALAAHLLIRHIPSAVGYCSPVGYPTVREPLKALADGFMDRTSDNVEAMKANALAARLGASALFEEFHRTHGVVHREWERAVDERNKAEKAKQRNEARIAELTAATAEVNGRRSHAFDNLFHARMVDEYVRVVPSVYEAYLRGDIGLMESCLKRTLNTDKWTGVGPVYREALENMLAELYAW